MAAREEGGAPLFTAAMVCEICARARERERGRSAPAQTEGSEDRRRLTASKAALGMPIVFPPAPPAGPPLPPPGAGCTLPSKLLPPSGPAFLPPRPPFTIPLGPAGTPSNPPPLGSPPSYLALCNGGSLVSLPRSRESRFTPERAAPKMLLRLLAGAPRLFAAGAAEGAAAEVSAAA